MLSYYLFFGSLYFIYGICIGSFLNVCICRIPEDISLVRGRSMCPSCGHTLHAADLVPILSWIVLRGKCRYCGAPISRRYPFVEFLTGVMYVVVFAACGPTVRSVIYCLFGSCLIAASGIDLDHLYVPDRFHVCIIILAVVSFFTGNSERLFSLLAGSLAVGGFMLLVSLATRGGIGGGDIRLMAASGLLLGLPRNAFAFILAYITAGIVCLIPMLQGRMHRKTEVPMVPFFAFALMVSALWGDRLLDWYLHLFL